MERVASHVGACLLGVHLGAAATEVAYLSEPSRSLAQKVSVAPDARAYRLDAARHIYESYASRIHKGRLQPLIHAVVVVETRSTKAACRATSRSFAALRTRPT